MKTPGRPNLPAGRLCRLNHDGACARCLRPLGEWEDRVCEADAADLRDRLREAERKAFIAETHAATAARRACMAADAANEAAERVHRLRRAVELSELDERGAA